MVETEEQEFNRFAKSSWRFHFFANLAMTDILEECRLCVKFFLEMINEILSDHSTKSDLYRRCIPLPTPCLSHLLTPSLVCLQCPADMAVSDKFSACPYRAGMTQDGECKCLVPSFCSQPVWHTHGVHHGSTSTEVNTDTSR